MVHYCSVPQCKSIFKKGSGKKFHKYPRNKAMLEKWMVALKQSKKQSLNAVVCSDHFIEADYYKNSFDGKYK